MMITSKVICLLPSRPGWRVLWVLLWLGSGVTVAEQADNAAAQEAEVEVETPYQSLLDRSPFLTRAYLEQQRRARRGAVNLVFNGYMRNDDGDWLFSLVDNRRERGYWVMEGEEIANVVIESFDVDRQVLHIRIDRVGAELQLSRPDN